MTTRGNNSKPILKLFTYGTLQPGGMFYDQIKRYVRTAKKASIDGDLYAYRTKDWPLVVPGNGLVHGTLLEMDVEVLPVLDRIEGCNSNDPESSLFIRALATTLTGDLCMYYRWADYGASSIEGFEKIGGGDFIHWKYGPITD